MNHDQTWPFDQIELESWNWDFNILQVRSKQTNLQKFASVHQICHSNDVCCDCRVAKPLCFKLFVQSALYNYWKAFFLTWHSYIILKFERTAKILLIWITFALCKQKTCKPWDCPSVNTINALKMQGNY